MQPADSSLARNSQPPVASVCLVPSAPLLCAAVPELAHSSNPWPVLAATSPIGLLTEYLLHALLNMSFPSLDPPMPQPTHAMQAHCPGPSRSRGVVLAGSLATLVLSDCSALQALPMFKMLGYTLEWLDLFNCGALTALPADLGGLAHIYELDLSGCSGLAALPDSLGDMRQLLRCPALAPAQLRLCGPSRLGEAE